jgi:hypothetical protein
LNVVATGNGRGKGNGVAHRRLLVDNQGAGLVLEMDSRALRMPSAPGLMPTGET